MNLSNPVSGRVEQIPTLTKFLDLFHESVTERIHSLVELRDDVAGVCCFEVLQMDSPAFGNRSAVVFGPGCTYKAAEEIVAGHLGSVPSRFAYPKYIFIK